jgi:hypothetical protein
MDDFDAQQRALEQRRLYANQLRQTEIPTGRMVGRIYVRQPGETIAAALRQYAGMKEIEDVDKQTSDLARQRNEARQADIQRFTQALRGTPERQIQSMAPTVGNDPNNPQMQTIPAVQADPYAAYSGLVASRVPELRQMGAQGLAILPQMEVRQSEREADRQFRREQQQEMIQARREQQAQAAADRRTLAGIAAGRDGGGKAPAGYRFTNTGNLEAIPGGPADLKKQGQFNADTASMQSATSALDRLAEVAYGLRQAPGLAGITGVRGAIPNIPGTSAADAQAQLETLKSQTAFGVLQAMRDASKTGGALGAVSEKELGLLQNNLAALDKAQSMEAYQKELDKILRYVDEAKGRLRNAYNEKHSRDMAPPMRTQSGPQGTVRKFNPATGMIE